MGEDKHEVVNFPLQYRTFTKGEDDITLVFNAKSQRVVFGDPKYAYRQINAVTLELLGEKYKVGDVGRFESNGLQSD